MIVVDVADFKISNSDEIITYSLGSCLGLTVYDPVLHIGGMVHCMLPLSKLSPEKAKSNPSMFVDTGVTQLFNTLLDYGSNKKYWLIKAAGCGEFMDPNHHFNIGERNMVVLKKILWKNRLLLDNSDVGGRISRTLRLDVMAGISSVSSGGKMWEI